MDGKRGEAEELEKERANGISTKRKSDHKPAICFELEIEKNTHTHFVIANAKVSSMYRRCLNDDGLFGNSA